jgi:hypothetical protein
MGINLIQNDGQHTDGDLPTPPSSITRIKETILLDERVQALLGPLEQAGFEVVLIPVSQRGTIPLRRPGMAPRPPILVTGNVRDWLEKNPDPMTLGVSLVNVAAILSHAEWCAAVLLRALTDPDVPAYDIFWCDFSPDGRRHLILFLGEWALIRMTVDYGLDLHTISIAENMFAKILAGLPVIFEGQGFPVEGVMEVDEWAFNCGAVGAIRVATDTGREVFEGNLGDAEVAVYRSLEG